MVRYLVERIKDGVFLDLDLDVTVDRAGVALSGYGTFSGTVEPDIGALRDEHGELIIDPEATFIHEEADGVIRGSWLVSRSELSGDSWKVEGDGFSSFLSGRPYEREYRGVQVDPIAVARHVVSAAQSFTDADYGVTLTGSSTVRVGTDSDDMYARAKDDYDIANGVLAAATAERKAQYELMKKRAAPFDKRIKKLQDDAKPLREAHQDLVDARKPFIDAYNDLVAQRKARRDVYDGLVKAKASKAQIAAAKAQVDALDAPIATAKGRVDSRKAAVDAAWALVAAKNDLIKLERAQRVVALEGYQAAYEDLRAREEDLKGPRDKAKAAMDAAKEKADADGGAWKILWWDTPDCFDAMQEAIAEAGFEWTEWSGWNADRTRIMKEIRCVPTVGARRDVRVTDDNLVEDLVVDDDAGEYANTVIALGAGEGSGALRVTVGRVDGARRRKVFVLDAKDVSKKSVLQRLADGELARRIKHRRISAARVDTSHMFTLRGTFGVGDTVYVDCDAGWAGRVSEWCRIEGLDWSEGDVCDLIFEGE